MMEKGFACLVEITAVLSVLGLTFQVQGGAMIGEGNVIFCTLSFAWFMINCYGVNNERVMKFGEFLHWFSTVVIKPAGRQFMTTN